MLLSGSSLLIPDQNGIFFVENVKIQIGLVFTSREAIGSCEKHFHAKLLLFHYSLF